MGENSKREKICKIRENEKRGEEQDEQGKEIMCLIKR